MTLAGVGVRMVIYLIPFIGFFGFLYVFLYPAFQIPINPILTIILGTILIVIGFMIYIKSMRIIIKLFKQPVIELITKGVFGHIRHPLYSSWILFITPGVACILNSWILFFIAVAYYIIFKILIKEEEDNCIEEFGDDYIHYKEHVNAIFPKLRKYRRS